MRRILKIIFVTALLAVTTALVLSSFNTGSNLSQQDFQDIRRLQRLRVITHLLDMYADANNNLYPPLPGDCLDISLLQQHLVPTYGEEIPQEPLLLDQEFANFHIGIQDDRKKYVLVAILENPNTISLANDLDGIVLGCQCDDPFYCITHEKE